MTSAAIELSQAPEARQKTWLIAALAILMRWLFTSLLIWTICYAYGKAAKTSSTEGGILAIALLFGLVSFLCIAQYHALKTNQTFRDGCCDLAFGFIALHFINPPGLPHMKLVYPKALVSFVGGTAAFTMFFGAVCLNTRFFSTDSRHVMTINGQAVNDTEPHFVIPWKTETRFFEKNLDIENIDAVGITKDGANIKGILSIPFRLTDDPQYWDDKKVIEPALRDAVKERFAAAVAEFNTSELNPTNLGLAFKLGTADRIPIPKAARWNGVIKIESLSVFFRDGSAATH